MLEHPFGPLSLAPPLIAIVLAIWWKNVLPALFVGIWVGATILAAGQPPAPEPGESDIVTAAASQPAEPKFDARRLNPWTGLKRMLNPLAIEQLASADHVQVFLFTLLLGSTIGVMSRSGGSAAVVSRLARYVHSRRGGQVTTWLAGLLLFIDDYANAILVGGTMLPVTDRLRISREKLAFIVDATSAPVAGMAVISTWAAFEISQIGSGFEQAGRNVDAFQFFIETIPYRFYPILMLLFVFAIAWTGRDFGQMLRAEREALDAPPEQDEVATTDHGSRRHLMRNALIPFAVLIGVLAWAFADDWARNGEFKESVPSLVLASFVASLSAVVSVLVWRTMKLTEAMEAWIDGAKSMFNAIVILTLAWMIAASCGDEGLNTATYLADLLGDQLAPGWLPAVAFLLSAAVSFATGTSYGTMGLLIPLFAALACQMLDTGPQVPLDDTILLATIGSVLAGSIFGDHCSPISDTTVLSSAASQCDHLQHVATQMPYALTVGGITLVLGCIPIGFGVNVWVCLALQAIGIVAVVRLVGRRPEAAKDGL